MVSRFFKVISQVLETYEEFCKDEETDTIKISVQEDYYDEDEDDDVQPAKIIKLSDDDINDLI